MGNNEDPDWTGVGESIEHAPDEVPGYDGEPVDHCWMILYPQDYETDMRDAAGNIAVLMDEQQAREVKRLAEQIIEATGGDGG